MLLSPWNGLNTNKMSFQNEVININIRRGKVELDIRGYANNFVVNLVKLAGRLTR
jgi:hypothetical protein